MRSIYMRTVIVTCFIAATLLSVAIQPARSARAQDEGQTVYGYPAVLSYTTDHPLDANLLILETPDASYAIAPLEGCAWVAPSYPVEFYTTDAGEPFIFMPKISRSDTNPPYNCHIQIVSMITGSDGSPQTCLKNDAGYCDVSLEQID